VRADRRAGVGQPRLSHRQSQRAIPAGPAPRVLAGGQRLVRAMGQGMNRRLLIALAALVAGLPLLGYLWPLSLAQPEDATGEAWHWPTAATGERAAPAPATLARFWPGSAPSEAAAAQQATQDASRRQGGTWALVGTVRQGARLDALVRDPQQNILTLRPGDAIGDERHIIEVAPTRLWWQGRDGAAGELPLYPEPTPPENR